MLSVTILCCFSLHFSPENQLPVYFIFAVDTVIHSNNDVGVTL